MIRKTIWFAVLLVLIGTYLTGGSADHVSPAVHPTCACSRAADSIYLQDVLRPSIGYPWTVTNGSDWLSGDPMSEWDGIRLSATGCVQSIQLDSRGLVGTLPPDMDQLMGLTNINFTFNMLTGNIPMSLGNLHMLDTLILTANAFSGNIPTSLGDLSTLSDLRLDDNQLTGDLPDELGNCTMLYRLYVQKNMLTGEIPANLSNTNLTIFFLNDNQFTGCIPDAFSTLPLNQLECYNNNLSCMPAFSNMTVGRLRVANNRFSFDDILPNLQYLNQCNRYAPQDSIGSEYTVTVPAGSYYAIDLVIDSLVASNTYEWDKDATFYASIDSVNKLIFNDIGFADAGTYTAQITNDSADCLTLFSRPVTIVVACDTERVLLDTVLCEGEFFFVNGQRYGSGGIASGEEFFPNGNRHGCDSLLVIQTSFAEPAISEFDSSYCEGDTISINGNLYYAGNAQGRDTLEGASQFGCDSIIVIDLTFEIPDTSLIEYGICEGDTINILGEQRTSSGVWRDTTFNARGCILSIVSHSLTVFPTYIDTLRPQICVGGAFSFQEKMYTSEGTYRDTLPSMNMCDSIFIIELSVSDAYVTEVELQLCAGETLTLSDGRVLDSSGIYVDSLQSGSGCDSLIQYQLTVSDTFYHLLEDTICSGDSVFFKGDWLFEEGVYMDTLQSRQQCDSTIELRLHVAPAYLIQIDSTICQGSYLVFNGDTLRTSQTRTDTFATANGCDSIIQLNLQVLENSFMAFSRSICQGQSYDFAGTSLTNPGIYRHTLPAANGCDSFLQLTLTVTPEIHTLLFDTICEGQVYIHQGKSLSQAGIYRDTFASHANCDSIVSLSLEVLPVSQFAYTDSICQGNSYTFGDRNLTAAGTYTDTLLAANGCDSILTLILRVLSPAFSDRADTLCAGDSVLFGQEYVSSSGTYRDTLLAANGCDSIAVLHVLVRSLDFESMQTSICRGDSIKHADKWLFQSGIYRDTFTNRHGCDSVVALELTVWDTAFTVMDTAICQGESLSFGGQMLTFSGTWRDTFSTRNGCDSVVKLNLQVLPLDTITSFQSICEGESYEWQGMRLTRADRYEAVYTNRNGCDSLQVLHLTVLPIRRHTRIDSICEGDQYVFFGKTIVAPGLYVDTATSSTGCDSIVQLALAVITPDYLGRAQISNDEVFTCTDSALIVAVTPPAGISGHWSSDGVVNLTTPDEAQSWVTGLSEGVSTLQWTLSSDFCPDYDAASLRIRRAYAPIAYDDAFEYGYDDGDLSIDVAANDKENPDGIWSLKWLQQPDVGRVSFSLDSTSFIYAAPYVNAQTYFDYEICHPECPQLCDEAQVWIQLMEEPLPDSVSIPNAFTPNEDGLNDQWVIDKWEVILREFPDPQMLVFNRWGHVVLEQQPYANNWDGTDMRSGEPLPQGTYYYILKLDTVEGRIFKGTITILR